MEKKEYILESSLRQLALLKIACALWNQDDVLSSFKKTDLDDDLLAFSMSEYTDKLIQKVKKKVSKLSLPNPLKEKVKDLIPPLFPEIIRWKENHQYLNLPDVTDQFCWTPQGTVDYRETAVRLIRQELVDPICSFRLACLYCLDDEIHAVWDKLSESSKQRFLRKEFRLEKLVTFWTYYLEGETDRLKYLSNPLRVGPERTLFQYAFEMVALNGHKVATEYFLQKLSLEEKEASLVTTANSVVHELNDLDPEDHEYQTQNYSALLVYLISEMNEDKQMEFFKEYPKEVLRCFQNWPWQDIFTKLTDLMWPFLSVDDYLSILKNLTRGPLMSEFIREKLFREFFLQSPTHYKNSLLDPTGKSRHWITTLFFHNNTEYIKLILKNVDAEVKESFITSTCGTYLCRELAETRMWTLLELLIEECVFFDEAKKKLKWSSLNFNHFDRNTRTWINNDRGRRRFLRLIKKANTGGQGVKNKRSRGESKGDKMQKQKLLKRK